MLPNTIHLQTLGSVTQDSPVVLMQVCVWSEHPLNSPRAALADVAILTVWWKGLRVLLKKLFVSKERNRRIITLKHNIVNTGKFA